LFLLLRSAGLRYFFIVQAALEDQLRAVFEQYGDLQQLRLFVDQEAAALEFSEAGAANRVRFLMTRIGLKETACSALWMHKWDLQYGDLQQLHLFVDQEEAALEFANSGAAARVRLSYRKRFSNDCFGHLDGNWAPAVDHLPLRTCMGPGETAAPEFAEAGATALLISWCRIRHV